MADQAQRTSSGLETLTDERERGLLRLDELRQRIASDDRAEIAEEALRELQATHEELQVSEEELRAQSQELAEAYQRLVHERQRYRDLFEHAPVGYLVTDTDGMIRDTNRTGANLLGRAQQYLRGKPLRLFVEEGERDGFSRWLTALRGSDGADVGDLRIAPRDAEPFDARCTVTAVRGADGSPEALRWVIHSREGDSPLPDGPQHLRAVGTPGEDTTDLSVEVVVLEPQALFVRTLDVLLETLLPGRARIAGATDDPTELADLVERMDPDVVVATVSELDGPAHAAVRSLRDGDDRPVLVLAGDVDGSGGEVLWSLIDEGLPGVLPRSAAPDAIAGALMATASGWTVLDRSISRVLLSPGRPLRQDLRDRLSDDQLELWRWLAAGRSDAEIARDRNVSTRTIKRRVADLYEELGVDSRVEAASLAGHYGLVDPEDVASARPSREGSEEPEPA